MAVPSLPEWSRWLVERPAAFRADPEGFPGGFVRVRAVVADLFEMLGGKASDALLSAFDASSAGEVERNRLRFVLAACHVLAHESLREAGGAKLSGVGKLLSQELASLAAVLPVDRLDADEERREELVRRALRALTVSLPGESAHEAEDRLRQVDSVERHRVLAETAEREKRARAVRDAMAKKAAEEAAAKVSRE
ncbi:MAG TPA: hypothetical protein VGR00_15300 [Thermoanaerobaculia bacterium]|nr:hypothetical protein [Thermoanaerobaculia bacterium]